MVTAVDPAPIEGQEAKHWTLRLYDLIAAMERNNWFKDRDGMILEVKKQAATRNVAAVLDKWEGWVSYALAVSVPPTGYFNRPMPRKGGAR